MLNGRAEAPVELMFTPTTNAAVLVAIPAVLVETTLSIVAIIAALVEVATFANAPFAVVESIAMSLRRPAAVLESMAMFSLAEIAALVEVAMPAKAICASLLEPATCQGLVEITGIAPLARTVLNVPESAAPVPVEVLTPAIAIMFVGVPTTDWE